MSLESTTSAYFYNPWSIPYFLGFLISLVIIGLLIHQKRSDKYVQLFLAGELIKAIFLLSAGMATCSMDPIVWNGWYQINIAFTILAVSVLYHFSTVYLKKSAIFANKQLLLVYVFPLYFLISPFLIPEFIIVEYGRSTFGLYALGLTGIFGILANMYFPILFTLLLLSTINFFKMYRQDKDMDLHRRAAYFILSSLIPLIGLAFTILMLILSIPLGAELSMSSLAITGAIMTYGILKRQLFDIDFFLKKTLVYTFISLVLIGLFRLLELGLSFFLSFTFFGGDITARLIAAAIVAGCFFPMRKFGKKLGDRLLPRIALTISIASDRELAIYHRQVELAVQNGAISEPAAAMLAALRADFGIAEHDHEQVLETILDDFWKLNTPKGDQ